MDKEILPKNIRQMGDRDDLYQIYLEDYAYTYIRKLRMQEKMPRIGVLVGKTKVIDGNSCQFIYGALDVKGAKITDGIIRFPEDAWKKMHGEIQAFFPEYELCGWYVKGGEGQVPELLKLQQAHLSNFQENGMLLFLGQEEEYSFWAGTGQNLFPVQGYYVFYERNEAMQEYMVRRSQGQHIEEEGQDQVTRHFRTALRQMQEEKSEQKTRGSRLIYGVCAAMGILVVGLGAVMLGGFDRGNRSEYQNQVGVEAGATAQNIQQDEPEVETVLGNLTSSAAAPETESETAQSESARESISGAETAPESGTAAEPGTDTASGTAAASDTEAARAAGIPVNGEAGGYHIVQEGDTLQQISINAYGTILKVQEICELNGIEDPDKIIAGQKLKMP